MASCLAVPAQSSRYKDDDRLSRLLHQGEATPSYSVSPKQLRVDWRCLWMDVLHLPCNSNYHPVKVDFSSPEIICSKVM